jgi:predicted secreted hydrolase
MTLKTCLLACALAGGWLLPSGGVLAADAGARAPGFAGLGGAAGNFATVTPGKPLEFPLDHAAHADYRIEWWYVTANLEDDQGKQYGVQWTLFRSALAPAANQPGWSNRNLWLGHAGLTTATLHRSAQTLARGGVGQAGVELQPFRAWIDDWSLSAPKTQGEPVGDPLNDLRVQAHGGDFSYDLHLQTTRPLVLQGQQGYSRKSEQGQASYYYSQPFFTARGQLQVDGQSVDVHGTAWLDREWSSQYMAGNQQGWDWFSLHLEDGRQLMLFRLRHADGKDYLSGNWIEADGRTEWLGPDEIVLTPAAFTTIDAHKVPTEWSVKIPGKGLDIRTTALNPKAWMALSTPYWEGPVRFSGSQQGVGYLEMTGY